MFKPILYPVILLMLLCGCDEERKTADTLIASTPDRTISVCDGKTMCFVKNDVQMSFNAKWRSIPASPYSPEMTSIFYDEDKGRFRIEINVYSDKPGVYGITDIAPFKSGNATFTYFDGPFVLRAGVGTVVITDINTVNKTLNGSFYAVAELRDTVYKFNDGTLANVPVK